MRMKSIFLSRAAVGLLLGIGLAACSTKSPEQNEISSNESQIANETDNLVVPPDDLNGNAAPDQSAPTKPVPDTENTTAQTNDDADASGLTARTQPAAADPAISAPAGKAKPAEPQ